jgi:hypothetical protein
MTTTPPPKQSVSFAIRDDCARSSAAREAVSGTMVIRQAEVSMSCAAAFS